jgi:hypothetical protein
MNAWTQRKLRGDDAARGAAFCAAPRARFRSSVQRNRGVSDPGSGAPDRPAPCSGVAHATAVRGPRIGPAHSGEMRRRSDSSACTRAVKRHGDMHAPWPCSWSTTWPTCSRSRSRHPARDRRAVLATVNALRPSRALRPRLRRGYGIDGVFAQLGLRRLRMAAVAHNLSRRRQQLLTTTDVLAILRMSSPAS